MDDLVQWLRAQLDDDERTARAVRVPPDWHQGPGDDPEWTDEELVCMWPPEFHTPYERDKHWRGLTVEGPELAAHIALHDPARVLREIDAKRQLLDLHPYAVLRKNVGERWKGDPDPRFDRTFCATCHVDDGCIQDNDGRPCETLRLLALPYAGRPGFRDEWRP